MRDVLLALFLLSAFPVVLYRFQVGAMVMGFISFMYPQSNTYGFAQSIQWLDLFLICTLIGYFLRQGYKEYKHHWVISFLMFFYFWVCLSTVYAIDTEYSYEAWLKYSKVLILAYIVYAMVGTEIRLKVFLKIMVLSFGFYGIKGGLFTIMTGGSHQVLGPLNSFFADNNRTALVLLMALPFAIFFITHAESLVQRYFAMFTAFTTAIAVLGTQSRTGTIALAATLLYFSWSQKKLFRSLLIVVPIASVAYFFMPQAWTDRMATSTELETDGSFLGRVDMWKASIRIANDHPFLGGGFDVIYVPEVIARYIPPEIDARAIHSSYFQMLAEHGYAGLIIFLSLMLATFLIAGKMGRDAKPYPDLHWIRDLSIASRCSIVGFAVMSLTANIAFIDLYYFVIVITLLAHNLLKKELTARNTVTDGFLKPAYA